MMWNDGPEFISELTDPWAPHPVVNRQVCCGGGGGGDSTMPQSPTVPDYSQYITAMTNIGNQLTGYGGDLYKWAQGQGTDLSSIAHNVSSAAGQQAAAASGTGQQMLSNWQQTYGPIYQEQAARTQQFMQDMPATQNQWAGQYGAQAGQAFDASAASLKRKLQGQGLSAPSVGTGAIDAATANQRAAGTTAAAEQGRMAAMNYGDQLVNSTLQQGQIFPTVAGQQQNLAIAAQNQQINAPESAVATTAGAYQPSQAYSAAAYPYMSAWGNTMANSYNQYQQSYQTQMQAYQAEQQRATESQMGTMAMIGSVAGSAMKAGATMYAGANGGTVPSGSGTLYDTGGAIRTGYAMAGNVVPTQLSPSGGAQTDDIPASVDGSAQPKAAINAGEFIFPKDVVQWRGEEWMQKQVAKAREDRQKGTVAAPQMAMHTGAPHRGVPA
jgi:hypothetical protein